MTEVDIEKYPMFEAEYLFNDCEEEYSTMDKVLEVYPVIRMVHGDRIVMCLRPDIYEELKDWHNNVGGDYGL